MTIGYREAFLFPVLVGIDLCCYWTMHCVFQVNRAVRELGLYLLAINIFVLVCYCPKIYCILQEHPEWEIKNGHVIFQKAKESAPCKEIPSLQLITQTLSYARDRVGTHCLRKHSHLLFAALLFPLIHCFMLKLSSFLFLLLDIPVLSHLIHSKNDIPYFHSV